ncbi:uncharacterized protein LOC112554779 isoform X3 [Pomacea canaliculata]|uniref:uncharacterized protein LOC112554779 isoform X3 n=1 Tax=Pomacea canaliculata TaxID=400727 RepID=UPI000D737904|nr:uncharacterized protein LOC112554779 isoform X3 [Pomacea canaliculata]
MAQDLINKTKVTLQTTVTEGAPEQRAAAVVSDQISATNPSPENVDGGKTSSVQTEVLLSQSKGHSFEMDTEDSSELGAERSSSSSQCSYAEVSNAMADEKASRTKKIVMSVTTHSSGFDADVGSDCKSTLQQSNLQLQVQRPTSPDHSQASLTLKPCVVKLIRLDDTPVLKMWLQAQQLKDETTNSHCPLQTEEPKRDPAMIPIELPHTGEFKSSYKVIYAETSSGSSSAKIFSSQSSNTEAQPKVVVPILNKLECDVCKIICTGRRGLLVHKRMAHGSFLCTLCQQVFLNKDQLQNHRCGKPQNNKGQVNDSGLAHVTVFPDRSSIVHKPGTPSYFRPAPKKPDAASTVTSNSAAVVYSDRKHVDTVLSEHQITSSGNAGQSTDKFSTSGSLQCVQCRCHFISREHILQHNCGKSHESKKLGDSKDFPQVTVFPDKTTTGYKSVKLHGSNKLVDAKETVIVFPDKSSVVNTPSCDKSRIVNTPSCDKSRIGNTPSCNKSRIANTPSCTKSPSLKSGAKSAAHSLFVAYPNGQYKQLNEAHALHPLEKMMFKHSKMDTTHTAVRKRKREPENKGATTPALSFVCPNCLCSYPSSELLEMHSCALAGSADLVAPEMSSEVERLAKFYSSIVYKE